MRPLITAGVVLFGLAAGGPAFGSEALAKDHGCLACHDATEKRAGPSIKDIAAKHKGKPGAVEAVTAQIKAGKGHPESKASDADLKAMVAWMLK